MKDFNPQGMPEENNDLALAQKCWDQIIFRIEEIEGLVLRDAQVAKHTCRQRSFNVCRGYTDTVEYKGKKILRLVIVDGKLVTIQKI